MTKPAPNKGAHDLLTNSDYTRTEFLDECGRQKITIPRVVRGFKRAILAKKTHFQKIRGTVKDEDLKKNGIRAYVVSVSDADTKDPETLLAVNVYDERLRFDALKELAMLFDLKPSAKHEVTGKDGGPIETRDPMSIEALKDAIAGATPK